MKKSQKNRSPKKNQPYIPHEIEQKNHLKDEIRINKFIAHAGYCSRRNADEYIANGKVKINNKTVTELGTKVKQSDKIEVEGQLLSLEPFVYILLNKPKDTISTTSDEKNRNTVMDTIEEATGNRVYPVGRLDRDTMGLLLLTNDGDLAHRLMHPTYTVKKTYEVKINRPLQDDELRQLLNGIQLEDGPARAEKIQRSKKDPYSVEITVSEGRNHLIKRMVSYFGAEVIKLKRIRYAGLSDKDLRLGRWRYLRQKEINDLRKMVKLQTLDFKKSSKL